MRRFIEEHSTRKQKALSSQPPAVSVPDREKQSGQPLRAQLREDEQAILVALRKAGMPLKFGALAARAELSETPTRRGLQLPFRQL
jgi:uncharacterized membrane protein